jgi:hypothetical protein
LDRAIVAADLLEYDFALRLRGRENWATVRIDAAEQSRLRTLLQNDRPCFYWFRSLSEHSYLVNCAHLLSWHFEMHNLMMQPSKDAPADPPAPMRLWFVDNLEPDGFDVAEDEPGDDGEFAGDLDHICGMLDGTFAEDLDFRLHFLDDGGDAIWFNQFLGGDVSGRAAAGTEDRSRRHASPRDWRPGGDHRVWQDGCRCVAHRATRRKRAGAGASAPVVDQWIERLSTFLDIPAKSLGRIGGGRSRPTGGLDVGIIQSLVRKGVVSDIVGDYGHVIIDECHHLSAHSFEQVARQTKARFVLGLSATVARKDGHHPIIFMQCGPVRHQVNTRAQAASRPFEHFVLVQPTPFHPNRDPDPDKRVEFQTLYQELTGDQARTRRICEDVIESVRNGRSPLILTERNDHLDRLEQELATRVDHVVVCAPAWARSSGTQSMSVSRLSRATKGESLLRLASTLARDSMIPVWTRCF